MYIPAELVLKTYKPLMLEPGMLFINILHKGTKKETVELFKLDKYPLDSEKFIQENGYPVELYIVDEQHKEVFATPDEIGWWDAGEETDELYDVTLKELNTVIQDYDGLLMIDVEEPSEQDEEVSPIKYLDKVTITYLHESVEECENDDWAEDDVDDDTWKETD